MRKKRARIYTNEMIFDYIVSYKKNNDGNSPTIREICDSLGCNSTSLILGRLKELEEQGLIRYVDGSSRAIEVIGGKWVLITD